MSTPVRCLLALALLLAGAGVGAGAAGSHDDGWPVPPRTVAADPLDTSWGDHYVRPTL
ncbi:hypothetical protein [Streptomyces sp. NPDC056144]|uniref:hypothetical protein n=1 Tax=unclassified Streptomyces TaxID=2593676 RepID=UPI0035D927EE